VGCDNGKLSVMVFIVYFNPRTPMWGATASTCALIVTLEISIRAPLCGVRPIVRKGNIEVVVFQSAHPYVGCDCNRGRSDG